MFAFFDDAETRRDNGLVFLGGYIAADEDWGSFSEQWNELLAVHGLKRLHTSDFLSGQAEYATLGLRYEERVKIVLTVR